MSRIMPLTSQVTDAKPLPSPSSSSRVVCDVGQAGAFTHRFEHLHVPVLVAFGSERLHQFGVRGDFDLDHAIAENTDALYRSIRQLSTDDNARTWDDLTFQFGPRSYLYADAKRIVGYAQSPAEAEALVTRFHAAYSLPPKPQGGSFSLITTGREIGTETVPLDADTLLNDDTLALHYGPSGLVWHRQFVADMRHHNHSLSVFEGPPGTGKTSYLRHLMGVLRDTHRFYFVPTAAMSVLSNPDFISFWAAQRRRHSEQRFVVILEDSDAALLTRGADNREQVSAILNLSDGMLADFLRLQIICTINCRAADIDPALLRPGRLLSHRIFHRLNPTEAAPLAQHLGRTLSPDRDYSLAELYAHDTLAPKPRRIIGFNQITSP